MCFRLSIWPNGHRESQKYIFRTNEAAGLNICPLIQLKIILIFHTRRLFGPESISTSSRKLVPMPLLLLGYSTPYSQKNMDAARNTAGQGIIAWDKSSLAVASRLQGKLNAAESGGMGRQPPPAKQFVARRSEPSARQAERSGKRGCWGGSPHLPSASLPAIASRLQDRPSAA
jgi:hypothetical protein